MAFGRSATQSNVIALFLLHQRRLDDQQLRARLAFAGCAIEMPQSLPKRSTGRF
jgi:hypothetical protein